MCCRVSVACLFLLLVRVCVFSAVFGLKKKTLCFASLCVLAKDGSPSLKTAICNAHRWCLLADKGEWKCECLKLKELLNIKGEFGEGHQHHVVQKVLHTKLGIQLRAGKMSMETNITPLKETVKKEVLKQMAILSCKLKSKILPAKLLNLIDDHYNNIKQNGLQDVHFKAQSLIIATMKVAVISPCDKNKLRSAYVVLLVTSNRCTS